VETEGFKSLLAEKKLPTYIPGRRSLFIVTNVPLNNDYQ
jgi:hypothetical protein